MYSKLFEPITMKKTITLLTLILLAGFSFAQEESEDGMKTLIKKNTKFGGFMGVTVKLSDVHDSNTILVGGTMGALFNDNFMFGFGGYGISSSSRFDGKRFATSPTTEPMYLYGGYGGLILGYKLMPNEIIHVSFPVLIGGGEFEVSHIKNSDVDNINFGDIVDQSSALVVEPAVEAEINVTKFFRIAVGGSYRVVQGLSMNEQLNNITDESMTSWATHISLKFGKFW